MTNYVTRDEIFQAADLLKAEGQQVSRSLVRLKLQSLFGKSGSDSTLSRYLKDWWLAQPENVDSLLGYEDIPDLTRQLFKNLYAILQTQVHKSCESELIDSLREQVEFLQNQLSDYEFIKGELSGLKIAYDQSLNQIQELTRVNERLQKFSHYADTNEPLIEKLDQIDSQLQESLANEQAFQSAATLLQQQLEISDKALQDALAKVFDLTSQLTQAKSTNAEIQSIKAENQQLQAEVSHLQAKTSKISTLATMMTLAGEVVHLPPNIPQLIEAEIASRIQASKRSRSRKPTS